MVGALLSIDYKWMQQREQKHIMLTGLICTRQAWNCVAGGILLMQVNKKGLQHKTVLPTATLLYINLKLENTWATPTVITGELVKCKQKEHRNASKAYSYAL